MITVARMASNGRLEVAAGMGGRSSSALHATGVTDTIRSAVPSRDSNRFRRLGASRRVIGVTKRSKSLAEFPERSCVSRWHAARRATRARSGCRRSRRRRAVITGCNPTADVDRQRYIQFARTRPARSPSNRRRSRPRDTLTLPCSPGPTGSGHNGELRCQRPHGTDSLDILACCRPR